MKYPYVVLAVAVAFFLGSAAVPIIAQSANKFGFFPVGTITNGQCLQVQASGPTNGLVGVTCPSAQPPLAIGSVVQGATPNATLATDASNKLTLVNGLIAQ